jgi:hypothetical protein
MTNLYKIVEYGYLAISLFFVYEAITTYSIDSKKAIIYLAFAILAVFMFFFKRNFRKKRFNR